MDELSLQDANGYESTFLASFLCFRCFAALAFSILCRNRTGVLFDFGSVVLSRSTIMAMYSTYSQAYSPSPLPWNCAHFLNILPCPAISRGSSEFRFVFAKADFRVASDFQPDSYTTP